MPAKWAHIRSRAVDTDDELWEAERSPSHHALALDPRRLADRFRLLRSHLSYGDAWRCPIRARETELSSSRHHRWPYRLEGAFRGVARGHHARRQDPPRVTARGPRHPAPHDSLSRDFAARHPLALLGVWLVVCVALLGVVLGYRPRRPMTCGMVRRRILMSVQSDQLAT
jgi:hypothetical protein